MQFLSNRLSQISNGYSAGRKTIQIKLPHKYTQRFSEVNFKSNYISILEILRSEGYIRAFSVVTVNRRSSGANNSIDKSSVSKATYASQLEETKLVKQRYLTVYLKYDKQGKPAIRNIYSISTPGRKTVIGSRALWQPLSTSGNTILSTPRGIITDREARILNVGGVALFGVY